jgi:hypothetical protein
MVLHAELTQCLESFFAHPIPSYLHQTEETLLLAFVSAPHSWHHIFFMLGFAEK